MAAAPPPSYPFSTPRQSNNPNIPIQSCNNNQVQSKPSQGQFQTNYPQLQAFQFNYKIQNNVEKRRQESNMLRSQFPNKIPIICEKDPKSNVLKIDKIKYLLPGNLLVSEFNMMIKKQVGYLPSAAFFLLANGKDLLNNNSMLSEVYNRYKDPEDNILYIAYTNQVLPSEYPNGKMQIKSPQGQVSTNYSQKQVPSKTNQGTIPPKYPQVKTPPKSNQKNNNFKDLKQSFQFKFKAQNPDAEQRRKECNKILSQFPGKIPIICEKDPNSSIKDIDKNKYLIPNDLTVSQFNFMIRKRIEISQEAAFYLLANGRFSITGDSLLSEIYERYKDPEDGFLYIAYASELTWGKD